MSDQRRPRPLAPAPGSGTEQPKIAQLSRREHTSVACTACKALKQKCMGGQPCEHCVKTRSECVIDETSDMRRRGAVKRKIEHLEEHQDLFLRLIRTLRRSYSQDALQLLHLIRSDAPLEEIKTFLSGEVQKGLDLSGIENQAAAEPQDDSGTVSARRQRMDIQRLTDNPPIRVPAKPWTSATDDDGLVSHLVSLWFTWNKPFWQCIDQKTFIRDMQAANLDCQFCSRFLVNAILADASCLSDYPDVLTRPGDLTSRGSRFYEEARNLLEEDAGRVCLPTLQGLTVLIDYVVLVGKDRTAWMYIGMASRAGADFSLSSPAPMEEGETPLSEMDRVVNTSLWGLFNAEVVTNFATMKGNKVVPPKHPRLFADHDTHDTWTVYPGNSDPVLAHTACIFNSLCDLNCILKDICQSLFNSENRPSSSEATEARVNEFHQHLSQWRESILPCLEFENPSVPHILSLHMCYQASILQIYVLLKNVTSENGDASRSERARDTSLAAARKVCALINIHRMKWGIDRMPAATIQWVSASLFALLDGLEGSQNRENRAAFIETCTFARVFSRRWIFAKGILRMIQIAAKQRGLSLPSEVDAVFVHFENDWDPGVLEKFSSGYPNLSAIFKPHVQAEDTEVDRFLRKWDASMNLED